MCLITDFTEYNTQKLNTAVNILTKNYAFVKSFSIGKSVLGQNITALKVGGGKCSAMYFAGVHANEYITTTLILRFLSEICKNLCEFTPFLDVNLNLALKNKSLIFVPMLNPDGCNTVIENGQNLKAKQKNFILNICKGDINKLKANINGVDINHNFPANWNEVKNTEIANGINGPNFGMFGGDFPSSEPETLAAINVIKIFKPELLVALHTQGEEIYIGGCNAKEYRIAQIFSCLCGYKIAVPANISLSGGLKDWYSLKFKKPAFTFECGKGQNPLPISEAGHIYKKIVEALLISAII